MGFRGGFVVPGARMKNEDVERINVEGWLFCVKCECDRARGFALFLLAIVRGEIWAEFVCPGRVDDVRRA